MKELLTDIFDRICIINLPERTDRRSEMELELKKLQLSYEHKNKIVFHPATKPGDKGEFPSIGARGCFLSHLQVLKNARDNQVRALLVMEDDLTISSGLNGYIPAIASALNNKPWSIIYLGHREKVYANSAFEFLPYGAPVITAHFYAVNANILDRLILFLETMLERPGGHPDGGPMHFDGALSTFRKQNPDVVTLLAYPNLGWQRSSRSNIAPKNWFDDMPVISVLVAKIRKLKNRLKG